MACSRMLFTDVADLEKAEINQSDFAKNRGHKVDKGQLPSRGCLKDSESTGLEKLFEEGLLKEGDLDLRRGPATT